MHSSDTPSEWIVRWSHLLPAGGAVLEAPAGTPVALHAAYDVLAVGRVLYNIAR